jgi:hypothetical protein
VQFTTARALDMLNTVIGVSCKYVCNSAVILGWEEQALSSTIMLIAASILGGGGLPLPSYCFLYVCTYRVYAFSILYGHINMGWWSSQSHVVTIFANVTKTASYSYNEIVPY